MLAKLQRIHAVLRKPADQRSFAEKLMISGAFVAADQAVNLFFRIGSTLIVTRLLAPEIFGLFALIMTFQTIAIMISDFGVRDLIIISDDVDDPDFVRTCWSVQAVRGLCLYGLVLLLALGLYSLQQAGLVTGNTVYAAPVLSAALATSGIQLVLQGFESVNQHVYARQMRFRRITILNMVRSMAAPLLTITIALVYPSVWALVIAGILGGLLRLVLSFRLFAGVSMRLRWKRTYMHVLWTRGRWIMQRSALTTATTQADILLLGAFAPASLLGLYFLAKQFTSLPQMLIQKLHVTSGLQLFREIMKLPSLAMREKYYRYRRPIDLFTCTVAGGTLTMAPALIDLLYDPRYLPTGQILQILGLGIPLIGAGMIREAYSAQERLAITVVFGLIQTITIWVGLIIALMIFENFTMVFLIIALHRLPEIATLLGAARHEGWVSFRQEIRFLPFVGLGALLGWGLSQIYFTMTNN